MKMCTKRFFLSVGLSCMLLFSLSACAGTTASSENENEGTGSSENVSGSSGEASPENPALALVAYPSESLVSATDLFDVLEQDAPVTVIDVRSVVSYKTACVPQSRSIPLERMQDRISEIPREGTLVLVSTDEAQASEAWTILANEGYDMYAVFVMPDDLTSWCSAGYEVATNAAEDCGC